MRRVSLSRSRTHRRGATRSQDGDSRRAADRRTRQRAHQRRRGRDRRQDRQRRRDATGAVTHDLGSLTLLPGFIDTHVHIGWHFDAKGRYHAGPEPRGASARSTAPRTPGVTLLAGFTTVQSVGAASDKPLRDAIDRGVLPGPRILTSLGSIGERQVDAGSDPRGHPEEEGGRRRPDQDLRVREHPRRRRADAVAGTGRRRVRRSARAGPAQHGARAQPRIDAARGSRDAARWSNMAAWPTPRR